LLPELTDPPAKPVRIVDPSSNLGQTLKLLVAGAVGSKVVSFLVAKGKTMIEDKFYQNEFARGDELFNEHVLRPFVDFLTGPLQQQPQAVVQSQPQAVVQSGTAGGNTPQAAGTTKVKPQGGPAGDKTAAAYAALAEFFGAAAPAAVDEDTETYAFTRYQHKTLKEFLRRLNLDEMCKAPADDLQAVCEGVRRFNNRYSTTTFLVEKIKSGVRRGNVFKSQ
jgi:hypothetical protein